jgi:hypothetical protein
VCTDDGECAIESAVGEGVREMDYDGLTGPRQRPSADYWHRHCRQDAYGWMEASNRNWTLCCRIPPHRTDYPSIEARANVSLNRIWKEKYNPK